MGKRYYYMDSLSAAWMAKHFGMRFIDYSLSSPEFHVLPFVDTERVREYQIHPDSEYLLKPRMGDVIQTDVQETMFVNYDPGLFDERHGIEKIIQRDGKPFFWPQSDH